jgi:hypothetical protein
MSTIPTTTSRFRGIQHAAKRHLPQVRHGLKLIFIRGPKQLLTSRISAKCAAIMVLMCSPSLLFCALLTLPAMIFQAPYQNSYFYFARMLENDPSRWFVLALTGICAILSLLAPATLPEPVETSLY